MHVGAADSDDAAPPFPLSYTADDTPMMSFLNVHTILNNRRQEALASGKRGPHCIILGPTDSGKSTLSRMLCNWAVRSGWEPTMVDLDIGQGSITTPGCIAATPIECPIDIEEGFPLEMPLVYFFGHATPSDNPELYKVGPAPPSGGEGRRRAGRLQPVLITSDMLSSPGWSTLI
jgi:hypothetical protein